MTRRGRRAFAALLAAGGIWVAGAVELAEHFSVRRTYGDHMVLQCDRPIRIRGTAAAGRAVRVSLGGHTQCAVADAAGEWCAELPAMPGGMTPYVLTVRGASGAIEFRDVLIGEVWLASGQSNMEMPVCSDRKYWGAADGKQEAAAAWLDGVRLYDANLCRSLSPGVEQREPGGPGWTVCTPRTAAEFSAVGFFFARELHRRLGGPVGVISASWGGTPIQSWIGRSGFEAAGRTGECAAIRDGLGPVSAERARRIAEVRDALKRDLADWQRRFLTAEPEATARAAGWKEVDFDDRAWSAEPVTGQPAYDFDGVFWYRRSVALPREWAGRALTLSLGVIDDCDEVFFNGERIGATGLETPLHWKVPRRYPVPASLVREGDNVIAVRVIDFSSIGGVKGPGDEIFLQCGDDRDGRIALDGAWKYREEYRVDRRRIGRRPAAPDGFGISPQSPHFPATLFNAMIAPWTGFPIRGVIWYQGESDIGSAERYSALFPLLIRDWRKRWGAPRMPFLFVQLAPLEHHQPSLPRPEVLRREDFPEESPLSELQEVQEAALAVPQTGMAVTIDLGDPFNVHPADKQSVAKRLAGEAMRLAYGSSEISSGPVCRGMKIEKAQIRLFFRNPGSGLAVRGERLNCFAIAGRDGKWVRAEARVEGDDVLVRAAAVREPVAVRYAWRGYPEGANLYNREGFPCGPFRTDKPAYLLQTAREE